MFKSILLSLSIMFGGIIIANGAESRYVNPGHFPGSNPPAMILPRQQQYIQPRIISPPIYRPGYYYTNPNPNPYQQPLFAVPMIIYPTIPYNTEVPYTIEVVRVPHSFFTHLSGAIDLSVGF
jgi:hypothetical protein